ncbi:MAG: cytochrome c [Actinobacteria bacterium]|nr:cytochrome c [Actinomycetota bacterium]
MKHKGLLTVALVLLTIGVIGTIGMYIFAPSLSTTETTSVQTPQGTSGTYTSIGQQIFLTGIGSNGARIPRTAASGNGRMGSAGCAYCHGANGQGGTFRMMGSSIDVPDITYEALADEGFTEETIAQAIRDGIDEQGEQLSNVMPRWQMSEADVTYTIIYLKELSVQ